MVGWVWWWLLGVVCNSNELTTKHSFLLPFLFHSVPARKTLWLIRDPSQNIGKVQATQALPNRSLASIPKRLSKMMIARQTVRIILGLLKAPQVIVIGENEQVKDIPGRSCSKKVRVYQKRKLLFCSRTLVLWHQRSWIWMEARNPQRKLLWKRRQRRLLRCLAHPFLK